MLPFLLQYGVANSKPIVSDAQDLFSQGIGEAIGVVNPTYGPTVALDLTLGTLFRITITNGVAFTVSNPTGFSAASLPIGTIIGIMFRNASGGAVGAVTMGALFKTSFAMPANGNSRTYFCMWDGTNWVEIIHMGVDTPN